jgi:hypothetical protein
MSLDHNNITLPLITLRIKLLKNQVSLLRYVYFRTTCFGPLRPSSGVYKPKSAFMFITNMHDAMNPLLIPLSYKKFLHKITMFKYNKMLTEY